MNFLRRLFPGRPTRLIQPTPHIDLVLKLHTDGSGRIQDNGTDKDCFTFYNFAELASWLNSNRPKPNEPDAHRPFHITNPCLGGFHSQCAGACDCRCHQPAEGIGA